MPSNIFFNRFCAHEYEKSKDMASAALAYKCMEVAYMRVVYSSHTSASRDRHELHNTLQMIPLGNEFCYLIFTASSIFFLLFKSSVSLDLSYIIPNPISILMLWQISEKYSDSFVKVSCLIHYNRLSEHYPFDEHSVWRDCG